MKQNKKNHSTIIQKIKYQLKFEESYDEPLTKEQLNRIDELNTCDDINEEEVLNRIF